MSKVVEISFVCLGNICRSPLAQGVFQDLVNREKLGGKIIVTSAGTGNWHIGDLPDERMRQIAKSKELILRVGLGNSRVTILKDSTLSLQWTIPTSPDLRKFLQALYPQIN